MQTTKFGERIRELRESRNLLQRQLAASMEMDTAMLSKIEKGVRKAKKEHVEKFAELLKTDAQQLLTLWLADQVYDILKNEDNASAALKVAEDEINYKRKNN